MPTDFSERANVALKYAVNFANQVGAGITALHVIQPPVEYPDSCYHSSVSPDVVSKAADRAIAVICEHHKLKWPLLRQTTVRQGVPYETIVETAKEKKVDLIILATHGHTGLARVLLGSTAEKVIRNAPCPVLVVRVRRSDLRGLKTGTNGRAKY